LKHAFKVATDWGAVLSIPAREVSKIKTKVREWYVTEVGE